MPIAASPKGAGKSTLVRVLCGLDPVRSGRIVKGGIEIHGQAAQRRAAAGMGVVLANRRLAGWRSDRKGGRQGDAEPFG